MRTIGLGFVQFEPKWSSSKDEEIGTVADLTALLTEIIAEELELDAARELPVVAVAPQLKRRTFKELGTPTMQARARRTRMHPS